MVNNGERRALTPLPSPFSQYMYEQFIPIGGRQMSHVTYLPGNKVRLTMEGIMKLEGEEVEYWVDDGKIKYTLPEIIRKQMDALYTTLVCAKYDADADVVRVIVKPPIIPQISMVHRRLECAASKSR